ncbi:uncharacterized protein LOC108252718 isoform X1 [Diaphorina citri]|uniref:ribonuclease H n=1 Tax=Diaphorina citri TaxID=121845 RepID=A0A3Q0J0C7_DIACI|nr:uncharacterized protein LOC108252718 isoform X1 [Diaphorina citri]
MGAYRQMTSRGGKLPARYHELLDKTQVILKQNMPTDHMAPKNNFDYTFQVLVRPRSDWEGQGSQKILNAGIKYFTDGSRMNEGTGAGLCGPGFCRQSAGLVTLTTVYQAELFAILMGARHALDLGWRGRQITFFSDSQAALNTLKSPKVSSKLAWECIENLSELAIQNKVNLEWIPGHRGFDGNESADLLAREAAEEKFIGPEPVLGLPKCVIRTDIKRWVQDEANKTWINASGMRHSKLTLEGYSKKKLTQEILALACSGRNLAWRTAVRLDFGFHRFKN